MFYSVQSLERNSSINLVHLNPNSFENTLFESERTMWFIGLDFEKKKGINIDLSTDMVNFVASGLF